MKTPEINLGGMKAIIEPVSPAEKQMADNYRLLLEEIKIRLKSIDHASRGKTGLHAEIAKEFCFLQLRMICEVIAVSCLLAHGNIKETVRLRKSWSADKIINELGKLHEDFFPMPFRMVKTGPYLAPSMEAVKPDELVKGGPFLKKEELLSLYNKVCGDALHRGSLKQLMSKKKEPIIHFKDVMEWYFKIVRLLALHTINTPDKRKALVGVMFDTSKGKKGKATVALWQMIPMKQG